jgi:Fe2+ or Zn2+ uptake regulation protein
MMTIAMMLSKISKDKNLISLLLYTEFRAGVLDFLWEKSSSRLSQQLGAVTSKLLAKHPSAVGTIYSALEMHSKHGMLPTKLNTC